MIFNVEYSTEAVMQLSRFNRSVAKRIMDRIDSTRGNPSHFFKRLVGRRSRRAPLAAESSMALPPSS